MENITSPQLVVSREICTNNVRRMAAKARQHNLIFRPHFKTHQSAKVGEIFREEGVEQITVSSVRMAEYFADHDWSDITIAFPVNRREIAAIRALNKRVTLCLLVESPESVDFLDQEMDGAVDVCIDIDTGYHRTGIDWQDEKALTQTIAQIAQSRRVRLKGLLTHDGHTYHAESVAQILSIHESSLEKLAHVKRIAEGLGQKVVVSMGDTPSCSLADNFEGVDEIRPGNFAYYDLQQRSIGSCTFETIAVVVACPVVAVYPRAAKIVVHGGAVHLSKQTLEEDGRTICGLVVPLTPTGWGNPIPHTYVASISQEHGIIRCDDPEYLSSTQPGDLIGIVPVHSCLAANLLSDVHFV